MDEWCNQFLCSVVLNRSWRSVRMPKLWPEDLCRTGATQDSTYRCRVTPHTFFFMIVCVCVHFVNVTCSLPSLAEFPTPKTELVQKFQVLYIGMMPVARPIGKIHTLAFTGMSTQAYLSI